MLSISFLLKICVIEAALLLSCYSGDYVLFNCQNSLVKALGDNVTHGVIGALSWCVVSVSPLNSLLSSIKASWRLIVLAGVISSVMDVDHFIQAGSLDLQAATSLKTRPFLHCSLLPSLYLLVSVVVGFISNKISIVTQGVLVFSSFFSHHLRDGSRRGIWVVSDLSIPLSYSGYIALTLILPLCYKVFLDLICDKYFKSHRSTDNAAAFVVFMSYMNDPPPPPPVPPPITQHTFSFPPVPPFYSWGTTGPLSYGAPPPPQKPEPVPVRQTAVTPVKPGKHDDFTQHALDTVVAAAGAVASQARMRDPELRETPHIRAGLAGVKRKGLASELLAHRSDSYHLSWTSLWDTPMPQQLLDKCKPLHCQLCSCQATSPVQAKMHYEGKTHDKNVRNFFLTMQGNTNLVLPQKLVSSEKKPKMSESRGPHCELCDIQFTSQAQSEQHLLGKNHQKKLASNGGPAKTSFYNKETNQWQRLTQSDIVSESLSSVPTVSPPSGIDPNFNKFYCDLCKVGAPSQAQMDMHLNGKSHKAKMKKRMGGLQNDDLASISKRVKLKEDLFSAVNQHKVEGSSTLRTDYSAFRTPSGQYYCAACNLSLNSESQFGQHQTSKKHKQKEISRRSRKR